MSIVMKYEDITFERKLLLDVLKMLLVEHTSKNYNLKKNKGSGSTLK